MDTFTQVAVIALCVVGIIVGGVYLDKNTDIFHSHHGISIEAK